MKIQKNVNNRNVRIHVRKGVDDPKTIVAAGVDISDGKLKVKGHKTQKITITVLCFLDMSDVIDTWLIDSLEQLVFSGRGLLQGAGAGRV